MFLCCVAPPSLDPLCGSAFESTWPLVHRADGGTERKTTSWTTRTTHTSRVTEHEFTTRLVRPPPPFDRVTATAHCHTRIRTPPPSRPMSPALRPASLVLALAVCLSLACVCVSAHSLSGEQLVFEDDFADELNHAVWEHELTLGGGGNWEFQVRPDESTRRRASGALAVLAAVRTLTLRIRTSLCLSGVLFSTIRIIVRTASCATASST